MNQRRAGLATAVAGSDSNVIHGAGYSSSTVTSISQLIHSMEASMGAGMLRSLPHPPRYSSLPSFAVPAPLGQPPLLPLPTVSKSANHPSPSGAAPKASRPRQNQKKNRASGGGSWKEPRPSVKQLPAAVAVDRKEGKRDGDGDGDDEEQLQGMLYSISPPPSSLPFPRFMLTKPKKVAAARCNVEAAGGSGGGGGARVEAGASDDPRL